MMRVQILLLSLASAPFVAAVAQSGAAAVRDPAQCQVADANRSPTSWSRDRKPDPQGRERTGCSPVAPVTTTPPPPPPPAGTVTISGNVWVDVPGGAGMAGWTIDIAGPVNASTVTNASGSYGFSGLPPGPYTVCEEVQSGWRQTNPTMPAACASGMGYTFTLTAGGGAAFVDFGNLVL